MPSQATTTSSSAGDSGAASNSTSLESFFDRRLPGSHFRDPLPTAEFVVSAICLLFFLVITGCYVWIKGKNVRAERMLRWLLGFSIFLMILYFGLNVADRVLLELELKRVVMQLPVMIALEVLSLFGDLVLMTFLLVPFAKELFDYAKVSEQDSSFIILCHKGFSYVLTALAIANPAAFIYERFANAFWDEETKAAMLASGSKAIVILAAYTKIHVGFYGLYLAGAFSITGIATYVLFKRRRKGGIHKTFLICLPLLIASLIVRTLGKFIYAILFKLLGQTQSLSIQLIHTIFYGFLTVTIYTAILTIAGSDHWDDDVALPRTHIEYGPVAFGGYVDTQYKAEVVTVGVQETPLIAQNDQGYTYSRG